jgi:hypothetical protein
MKKWQRKQIEKGFYTNSVIENNLWRKKTETPLTQILHQFSD